MPFSAILLPTPLPITTHGILLLHERNRACHHCHVFWKTFVYIFFLPLFLRIDGNGGKYPANPYGVRLTACHQGGKLVARMVTFLSHPTKFCIGGNFQIRPEQFQYTVSQNPGFVSRRWPFGCVLRSGTFWWSTPSRILFVQIHILSIAYQNICNWKLIRQSVWILTLPIRWTWSGRLNIPSL